MLSKYKTKSKRETKVFRGFSFFLILCLLFVSTEPRLIAYAKEKDTVLKDSDLYARAALLMEGNTGQILYSKNGEQQLPMASTTKIMTLIVLLEQANPDDIVTFSQNAASQPDVQMNAKLGEQYYLRDLYYSLMLESHNDTAVALAEHIGGTVEGFAEIMNQKAKEIGAENTHFVTPNGLDAKEHYTTAYDLALITYYALKIPEFVKITTTKSHTIKEINGKRTLTVTNKNRFLSMMEGAIGVKTGFTGEAGYCFVGAIQRADRVLISVVLGCRWPPFRDAKWTDTRKLMDYGLQLKKYTMQDFLSETQCESIRSSLITDAEFNDFLNTTLLLEDAAASIHLYKVTEYEALPNGTNLWCRCQTLYIYFAGKRLKKIPIQTMEPSVSVNFSESVKKIIYLFFATISPA